MLAEANDIDLMLIVLMPYDVLILYYFMTFIEYVLLSMPLKNHAWVL